jgi:hypothetical protein
MKKVILMLVVALFTTFAFAQTKTEMKPKELSKSITDYVTTNMAGYTIDKAFKVDSKGVITYNILVVKGTVKHILVFDKEGKFLEKGDHKAQGATKTVNETNPTPTPAQKPPASDNKDAQPAKK